MQRTENDTGNVSAGNIRNAKVFLSNIGHCKTECKAGNRYALRMGIAGIQPLHDAVEHIADTNGNQKEQRGLDQHAADAGALTGAGTQHTGQHDNADDIINDGSADNGSAKEAL